jgi:phosphatidylglycerophosphate synthase
MVAFFSKWFTANHLTTLRVALVPIIYTGIVIGRDEHWILFSTWLVFLFACLTDYWDGVLARHQGKTTKLGKLLDPVADKIQCSSLPITMPV